MRLILLYLHILLFNFPFFSSSSSNFSCHPQDSYALLQFKSSFTTQTLLVMNNLRKHQHGKMGQIVAHGMVSHVTVPLVM
ncbi:receptor protein Cf-9 [Trifolium repens]|nr:receptor protein Cf-9 [Trifolium repens]